MESAALSRVSAMLYNDSRSKKLTSRLTVTRSIIDAIHDGSLAKADFVNSPVFNLATPTSVPGNPDVSATLLDPSKAWADRAAFDAQNEKLAKMFDTAFARYAADCSPEVVAAGPKI